MTTNPQSAHIEDLLYSRERLIVGSPGFRVPQRYSIGASGSQGTQEETALVASMCGHISSNGTD